MTLDTSNEHSSHGGKREGAGRKTGSTNEETRLRATALKNYRARVAKKTDQLLNAQMANAMGNTYLYRIDETEKTINGKKTTVREHVLVTDPDEITQVLDENDGAAGTVDDNYYYITTVKPDNKAIDSIMDRAYGKATTPIEIKKPVGEFVSPKVQEAMANLFTEE